MRHSRSQIFDQWYISQISGADTQSAYLETSSRNALVRLASHMSLTRDPRAMAAIRQSLKMHVQHDDSEVRELEEKARTLKANITGRFGMIKCAVGTTLYDDYQNTLADLRRRKKQVERETFESTWDEYFKRVGCEEIDRQRRGQKSTYTEPRPVFPFEERAQLADWLWRNADVDKVSLRRLKHFASKQSAL